VLIAAYTPSADTRITLFSAVPSAAPSRIVFFSAAPSAASRTVLFLDGFCRTDPETSRLCDGTESTRDNGNIESGKTYL
jgi:hypothetical protein